MNSDKPHGIPAFAAGAILRTSTCGAQALRETALKGPADQSLASALGLHGIDGAQAANGAPAEGGEVDRDIALAYMGLRPSGGAGGSQGEGALALGLGFRGARVSWFWPGFWRVLALALSRQAALIRTPQEVAMLPVRCHMCWRVARWMLVLRSRTWACTPAAARGVLRAGVCRPSPQQAVLHHMPCHRLRLPWQVLKVSLDHLGADAVAESRKCGSLIRARVRRPVLDALR